MSDLWPRIEPLLARVEKPARYIGMEMGRARGSRAPRHGSGRAAFLLIYPDTYEIGLPNQGLQILYELLNERDDAVAERAYAPWTDMEAAMRAARVPLFSVDTHRAAPDFDVLAFNLSAELVYTNLLNLVDLAGGPVVRSVTPRYADVPAVVDKRTVADLAEWPYPKRQLVPLVEVVHDRLNVEIFRGCTRGCRFCQAGMITRPVRERPEEQVRTMVKEGLRRTGYDEVALTSLSSADFSGIEGVVADLVTDQEGTGGVSVSLPSLRVDAFTVGIASELQKVRRSGLTFAPEAGTWRLRQVINKLIIEDDLYSAVDAAYSQGWRRVKLYFLTGLPTEMDEDTLGIAQLATNVTDIGRKYTKQASCTVSVGGFVPKPHTPFQWFGQNGVDELQRKITLLRNAVRGTRAQVKWHDPSATFAEGIASRGDRRIGRVIERVWRAGGTVQDGSEGFSLDLWLDAMRAEGLDPDWFVTRP